MGKKSKRRGGKRKEAQKPSPPKEANDKKKKKDDDWESNQVRHSSREGVITHLLEPNDGPYSTKALLQVPSINGDAQFLFNEAVKYNLVERMHELVVEFDADVNQPAIETSRGLSTCTTYLPPLSIAVCYHQITATKWLLEHGANVDGREIYHYDEGTMMEHIDHPILLFGVQLKMVMFVSQNCCWMLMLMWTLLKKGHILHHF